ncbi:MAG: DUF1080 domain-containing protein [Pseudomonadales bacterium]|nr:DUF1080 domain-containing protein [Pseudomonadales bacterium]
MRLALLSLLALLCAATPNVLAATADERAAHYARAQVSEVWDPEPQVVVPGTDEAGAGAPSDAIILFDGADLSSWESVHGGQAAWLVQDGAVQVAKGTGDIQTKRSFTDLQLHIEWASPSKVESESQGRGNSGVFLMDRYEVQVLDSYQNRTYSNGQAASIYKQHIPLVNASRGPGEWQSYDILFTAPRFAQSGRVIAPAYVTVLHNGVLVQNHVAVEGTTEFVGRPLYKQHGAAPIRLQDHGNDVRFRNIWVREL